MTLPFSQYDDEEERKRLEGIAMPELTAPDIQDPRAAAIGWLGGGGGASAPAMPEAPPAMSAMQPQYDIPEPPHMRPNTAGLIAAAIADLALNKGRSLGTLIGTMATSSGQADELNWRNQRQTALDRASIAHQLQASKGNAIDPERAAIMREENAISRDRLAYEREALAARAGGGSAADPNSDDSARARQIAMQNGATAEQVNGMSAADVAHWRPQLFQLGQTGRSGAEWDRRESTREQTKLDAEGRKPALAAATAAAATTGRLNATNGTPDEAAANFQNANPKLEITDQGTFRTIANNPRTMNARQQQLMTVTRALDASATLRQIEREYSAVPFEERLGDKATALAEEYDKLKTEHQGIMQKIAGQGSGSSEERDLIRAGLPSIHDLRAQSKLAGIEAMLHLNSSAMLAPYGIGIRGEGKSKKKDNFGTTSGKLPKVNDLLDGLGVQFE
jgi:hypothetical protein